MTTVAAVVAAAGAGTRLGHPSPKAFVEVDGVSLLAHAVGTLAAARTAAGDRVVQVVVVVPGGHVEAARAAVGAPPDGVDLWVVEGGASRQASVAAGLAALGEGVDVVLVHDAARAFASPRLVARVIEAVVAGHAAVVPGLAVVDTVKQVEPGDGAVRRVVATVPRDQLVAVQTPQGFARDLLVRAHAHGQPRACDEATAASDDAGLVEALGEPVWVVPGEAVALKVTGPADLRLLDALRERR